MCADEEREDDALPPELQQLGQKMSVAVEEGGKGGGIVSSLVQSMARNSLAAEQQPRLASLQPGPSASQSSQTEPSLQNDPSTAQQLSCISERLGALEEIVGAMVKGQERVQEKQEVILKCLYQMLSAEPMLSSAQVQAEEA